MEKVKELKKYLRACKKYWPLIAGALGAIVVMAGVGDDIAEMTACILSAFSGFLLGIVAIAAMDDYYNGDF